MTMTAKLSKFVLICGLATATLGAGNVMAKGGMNHHGDRQAHFLLSERGADKLDLTEAQQTQLKAIFDAKKAERKANRKANKETFKAERKADKAKMDVLFSSPTFDESAAQELISQHTEKAAQRQMDKLKTQHQIYQILNAEQREILADMKDRKGKKGRKGHNKDD